MFSIFSNTKPIKSALISLCLLSSSTVIAEQEVKWFVQEWKPFNITRGSEKHTGSNDELIKFIHRHMPQYKLKWVKMDLNHFVKSLKIKQDICKVDFFKTDDRQEYALFSEVPSVIDLNLRVFLYEKKAKKLNLKNPVSIAELLANENVKTYFPLARKYGENLDPIIARAEVDRKKLRKDIAAKKLIKNFYKQKIDYLVEYSPVVKYYSNYAELGENLTGFTIKETSPYIKAYVACAKTEFGNKVMQDINKILIEHRHTPEYLSIFEKWLSDKERETLRAYYPKFK